MMKRLTSILLALLMLVGMALAEETPEDTLLGNWYGLNAQTIVRLTMKEDGEFKLVVGYLSYTGSWQQTAEGEYRLESPDMATDILLRETETGLELRYDTIDTDTPLEAFQGVWSAEYARSGSTLTSLGTDENGAPLPFCTVSGTDITLYTITDEVDLTYPATLKDGVLSMTTQEKGQTLIVELFQTEEGGMYATFSVNIVGMSNTLVLELSPAN